VLSLVFTSVVFNLTLFSFVLSIGLSFLLFIWFNLLCLLLCSHWL
jgi:hypothetical protein